MTIGRTAWRHTAVMLALAALGAVTPSTSAAAATSSGVAAPQSVVRLTSQPIGFEANGGQAAGDVRFLARIGQYRLLLSGHEAILDLRAFERVSPASRLSRSAIATQRLTRQVVGGQVRMRLVGADPRARIDGLQARDARVQYSARTNGTGREFQVDTFGRVRYTAVYPGIDLVYYGTRNTVEYDFVVAPGANPGVIAIEFHGADALRLDASGDLVIRVGGRDVRQRAPVVYQDIDGVRRPVHASYVLHDRRRVGFALASWDRGQALVIDPVVDLGAGGEGIGDVIAADAAGNSIVAGYVLSVNPQTPYDFADAFVSKMDPNGAVLWSRILSGQGTEFVNGIAVDAGGNILATGATNSANFPATGGAFQPALSAGLPCGSIGGTPVPCGDAFVVKLNPAGGTVFSTFLGSSRDDFGMGVTTDPAGNVYVTGGTASAGFPLVGAAAQTTFGGGPSDAFVAKFTPAGAAVYTSFLGGAGDDAGSGIAVSAITGEVTITGETFVPAAGPPNFPTRSAFQPTFGGGNADGFVSVFRLAGATPTGALACSSYLGGDDHDFGVAVGVDAAGNRYLVGNTISLTGTVTTTSPGFFDAYVAKLNAGCFSGLAYSVSVGGASDEIVTGGGVTLAGDVYVAGMTFSSEFVGTPADEGVVFVTKLTTAATPSSSPAQATASLGVTTGESLLGLAVDAAGSVYVAGASTTGLGIKIEPNAFPPSASGGGGHLLGIDIKPGGSSNNVHPGSPAPLTVAILSSATFDAPAQIDPETVRFGGTGGETSRVDCPHVKDVNGDGWPDLLCRFVMNAGAFRTTDTQGVLRATTFDGTSMIGSDAIRIVGPGEDEVESALGTRTKK